MHARLCPDVRSLELDLWGPRWWGEGVLGGAGRDPLTQVQPLHVVVCVCRPLLCHPFPFPFPWPSSPTPRLPAFIPCFPAACCYGAPFETCGAEEREDRAWATDGFVSPHFFRPTLKAPFPSPSTQTGIPPTCLQLHNMHYLKVYLWLRCAPCCLQAAAR